MMLNNYVKKASRKNGGIVTTGALAGTTGAGTLVAGTSAVQTGVAIHSALASTGPEAIAAIFLIPIHLVFAIGTMLLGVVTAGLVAGTIAQAHHKKVNVNKTLTMLNKNEILNMAKRENREKVLAEARLPVDGSDPQFGVPEQKKFPLFDESHVRSAIKFFNHVDAQYEQELARAIIAKMKKYGISYDSIGKENKLYNWIPNSFKKEKNN